MLPDNFQVLKEERKTFPPLPKNIYQAELLTIELKDAKGQYAKQGEKIFSFQFTLLDGQENGQSLRGRNVWSNFVPTSLYIGKNGKNELYQIVEAYLRRELTQAEEAAGLSGSMLNSFIGKQVKIFVDHKISQTDKTKVYDNITSYISADVKLQPLTEEEKEEARVKVKKEATQAPVSVPTPQRSNDTTPVPNTSLHGTGQFTQPPAQYISQEYTHPANQVADYEDAQEVSDVDISKIPF